MPISGMRVLNVKAQASGRKGLRVSQVKWASLRPLRDSGSTKMARAKFTAFSAAATRKGERTQTSPSTPPNTGPTMKPMPNMAWNSPNRPARSSSLEMSVM
ncbi:hypothetical protein D3C87_1685260 [compost metagenome]